MALRVITADSFGGLEAARANADQRRQMALVQAFEMNQRIGQEAARQRELRDSVMRQDRNFNEGVRQFDVNTGLYRDQLNQRSDTIPAAIQTEAFKTAGDLARIGGLTPEVLSTVPIHLRSTLIETDRQAKEELTRNYDAGLQMGHVENTRRRLNDELKQTEKTMKDIPFWRKALSRAVPFYQDPMYDIYEPRARALRESIGQLAPPNPNLDDFTQIDPRNQMRYPMIPVRPGNAPVRMLPPGAFGGGTNAPVMNLPRTNSIPMMRPNVPPMMMQTNAPMTGTNGMSLESIRAEAIMAIQRGKDPVAVSNRFFQMTGQPLR